MPLARKAADNGRQTSRVDRDARARCPAGAARLGPLPAPPLRAADRAVPARQGRPRRSAADRRRLRSDDAVQPALRVLLRHRLPEHRGRVAAGDDARSPAPGLPRSARLPGQPHRRRDLHAQGHHVRAGPLPGEGLLLRLPDDQRHDHQRGTGRGAGRSGGGGLPEAHQRVGRRARGTARSRARVEGHIRTHVRRVCAGSRRRRDASTRRSASASTRPSRTRASRRSTRWSTSPRSSASTPSASTT